MHYGAPLDISKTVRAADDCAHEVPRHRWEGASERVLGDDEATDEPIKLEHRRSWRGRGALHETTPA